MAPEIAVLYAGLKLVRVPWAEKETLKRDQVLSITILHPNRPTIGNPPTRVRYQAISEYDWYVLSWTNSDSYLGGYDNDMCWRSFDKPEEAYHRFPYILPENSLLFEGIFVSKEEYVEAKIIFNDRNGRMF